MGAQVAASAASGPAATQATATAAALRSADPSATAPAAADGAHVIELMEQGRRVDLQRPASVATPRHHVQSPAAAGAAQKPTSLQAPQMMHPQPPRAAAPQRRRATTGSVPERVEALLQGCHSDADRRVRPNV